MSGVMRMFSLFLLSSLAMSGLTFSTNKAFAGVETGVDVGQKAAPIKLLTIEGKELELKSFAKGKVTLLVLVLRGVLHADTKCRSLRSITMILKIMVFR